MQRRAPVVARRVLLRAGLEEHDHRRELVRAHGEVRRGLPVLVLRVDVGTLVQQAAKRRGVALQRRAVQRRGLVARLGLERRARLGSAGSRSGGGQNDGEVGR